MINVPYPIPDSPLSMFPVMCCRADQNLETVKDNFISMVLEYHEWNTTNTAKSLGISNRTLQRWMRDHGWVTCSECKGTGKIWHSYDSVRHWTICSQCNGRRTCKPDVQEVATS
jgi:DnaJ-class molecular chaperone